MDEERTRKVHWTERLRGMDVTFFAESDGIETTFGFSFKWFGTTVTHTGGKKLGAVEAYAADWIVLCELHGPTV